MSRKSSQRRIEANRRNAVKSTGPRTPEGKARSAGNATTHGLSSLNRNPLSPGCFLKVEDENDFKGLLEEYTATYQPQHRDESDLLSQAVYALWLQQRGWAAQTSQLEIAIARNERDLQLEFPQASANTHLANGFAHSADLMRLYLRYDAQCHRHYKSCLKQLQDLQALRQVRPDPPIEPNQPQPGADPRQTNPDQGGDPNLEAGTPNESSNEATSQPEPTTAVQPNEANPTFEQARLEYMKAEIRRFEEYQARVLAHMNPPSNRTP